MTVTGQSLAGFRLTSLQVRNWGTFDDLVWTLVANGRNTLVTGDIGSGKSTIVDAVTTLLLPANHISYNKAAGADAKERSLRSYVLGYYTSVKNEMTGTTRPIALRDATKFTVVLGVFSNAELDATVTLAQVFWMKSSDASGQPEQSTRFALRLFEELGIQLLIVTPLQKIHVIEPYVAAVGFVDNPTSRYSRLRTLTIEEYQAERAERVARATDVPTVTAVA